MGRTLGRLNEDPRLPHGTPRTGIATAARAEAAGTTLHYDGRLRYDGALGVEGRVAASARQLATAGALLGIPLPEVADVTLAADASSSADGAVALRNIEGSVAGSRVTGSVVAARTGLTGDLALGDIELASLARLVLGEDAGAAPQTGRWPASVFSDPMLPPVRADLAITAASLSIAGETLRDARFGLELGPRRLAIEGADAALAGGRVSGALSLVRDGARATLEGRLAVTNAALAQLAWRSGEDPAATGTMTLSSQFSSAGYTVAGLIGGLTGSGWMTLEDGRLRDLNPAPFDLSDDALDGFATAPTEAEARSAFESHLAADDLGYDRIGAELELSDGSVRLRNVAISPPVGVVVERAALDLDAWEVRADLALATALSGGQSAPVGVAFAGPLGAPQRTLDVAQLTSWIGLRQIERQVEAVEQDNRALEAEANARGAPSSELLDRLDREASPAPTDPVPDQRSDAGAIDPVNATAAPGAEASGDATSPPSITPSTALAARNRLTAPTDTEVRPPDPTTGSGERDGPARDRGAGGPDDRLGAFLRSVEEERGMGPDGDLRPRGNGRRIEDELRSRAVPRPLTHRRREAGWSATPHRRR